MSQFYISALDAEADVRRCHDSISTRTPITITGATEGGEIKGYEGIVQSIQDNGEGAPAGRRWRVTIGD